MKQAITDALNNFSSSDLRTAAIGLLNTLGYESEKTLPLESTPEAFRAQFGRDDIANWEQKALFDQWQTVDFLFQLTDDELSDQAGLFENNAVDTGLMRSYLFFALELKGTDYARGKLTRIARQINRLFPTPVMVLIKHIENDEPVLSIAVINRRQNKRDADQDVLGKVTIIRNISLARPHRGHLDILASFATENLVHPERIPIDNFDALHAAWEEVFNVELLNKRFYRELSNWYFWAMQKVRFPYDELKENAEKLNKDDLFQDEEKIREHDAKNLIRLLTRLLFVWFIKEKHLVPEALFEENQLQRDILKGFDPHSEDTRYYKAILQNLFFATLNQTHKKREFRKPKQHRNTTTLMRYEKFFQDPDAFIDLVESVVPFMNGGLFECLDKPHPEKKGPQGGDVILYEDGFSDRDDNILAVPDLLFFGAEQQIDLSDVYGDKKRRSERVRGIIPILNSYKFTIVENTPIDQEIALDPELLGKVFENLLASYNPETKTTARKQTGSFYTPRTIVDYMVDESLIAYLAGRLKGDDQSDQSDQSDDRLRELLSYTDEPHRFSEAEVLQLIEAIDNCKILDPACGSGAFPMGILHKLEFILAKLDPQNRLWRDRQIEKVDATIAAAEDIDDASVCAEIIGNAEAQKRDIEDAFANNELGYPRKLYLIENCIYGVDIQSIATQVSKLRFFISLIVDQRVHSDQANFGIRALPNLETKFATANTLIQVQWKGQQLMLTRNKKVQDLEKELKKVRHEIFSAKKPGTKRKHRERDKELRTAIAAELESQGLEEDIAHQLAAWDPYDQNASAPFFDPEWMFDVQGFDIVIGNPPYIQIQKFPKEQKELWKEQGYQTYAATADIYCLFYERGIQILRPGGHLFYISSNKWMRAGYGEAFRRFLAETVNTGRVLDFGMAQNFGAATTYTCVMGVQNAEPSKQTLCCYVSDDKIAMADPAAYFAENAVAMPDLDQNAWVVVTPECHRIKKVVEEQGVPLKDWDLNIYRGVLTGLNEAFYLTQEQRDELIEREPQAEEIIVPLLRGRYVRPYATDWQGEWMINSHNGVKEKGIPPINIPKDYPVVYQHLKQWEIQLKKRQDKGDHWTNLRNCAYIDQFQKPKIIYQDIAISMPFYFDETDHFFFNNTCWMMNGPPEVLPYLTAIFNSPLFRYCFRDNFPEYSGNACRMFSVFFEKIPIRKPKDYEAELFTKLVQLVQLTKREGDPDSAARIQQLIDACVMELYFPKEASEKDLKVVTKAGILLQDFPRHPTMKTVHSIIDGYAAHSIDDKLSRMGNDGSDVYGVVMGGVMFI